MDADFLRMGGYAAYVWPSVALVLGVLAWNVWSARTQLAAARKRVQRAMTSKTTVKS